jgi:hypothetical protein
LSFYAQHPLPTDVVTSHHRLALEVNDGGVYFMYYRRCKDRLLAAKFNHNIELWDLGTVQICLEAGEGAWLNLHLGGKSGTASGQPLDLRVQIRTIKTESGHMQR